jgi:hypothetical protein
MVDVSWKRLPATRGMIEVAMPDHRAALLAACRDMARKTAARPLEWLPEVENGIIGRLDDPAALTAVVRARNRRRREVALANAFAIGRQAGLSASRTRRVIEAGYWGGRPRPRRSRPRSPRRV